MKPLRSPVSKSLGLALLLGGLVNTAFAAPEEIQVYLDEFAEVGQWGLDVHSNYVTETSRPNTTSRGMLRATPELSWGLSKHWEVAGYWMTSKGPEQEGSVAATDGLKVRVKWRPFVPSEDTAFYGAVNLELGRIAPRFFEQAASDADIQTTQLKLIGMWKSNQWVLGANLNFDRASHTAQSLGTTTELDTKIAYKVGLLGGKPFQIGLENYDYRGALSGDLAGQNRSSLSFLAFDFELKGWELNLGLGRASGATEDKGLIKAVIGVPL